VPTRQRPRPLKGHILLDEKAERRLRRIRWRRIGIGLGLMFATAGIVALYLSPLLRVQSVEVVGATTVNPDFVAQIADLQGESMLRINLAEIESDIERIPMVLNATVQRKWPNSVHIEISERQPWGIWQSGAEQYVIDAEGVVLSGVAAPESAPLIVDTGPPRTLIAGDHVDADAVLFTHTIYSRVPEQLGLTITALQYSEKTGLTVHTGAAYSVVLGDSQNAEYKLAVWKAIEDEIGREAMSGHVLDLRFGDRPALRPEVTRR
jgi:cell division protein FtsQ